jgi:hypothetical protein
MDGKINNHNAGIAIDQQMSGVIAMKKTDFMEGAIISDICPGHLAHKKDGNAA